MHYMAKRAILTVFEPFQVPSNAGLALFPAKKGVRNGRWAGCPDQKKLSLGDVEAVVENAIAFSGCVFMRFGLFFRMRFYAIFFFIGCGLMRFCRFFRYFETIAVVSVTSKLNSIPKTW